jgi:hypothetical protein
MKSKIVFSMSLLFLFTAAISESRSSLSIQQEMQQVQLWETQLNESMPMNARDKFDSLWLGLRNMGFRKLSMDHDASVDMIFNKIQHTFLLIPGHAQYIADEVERKRKEEEHLPRANQTSYDQVRETLIGETLIHLPSPETIQVLGDYLSDERDPAPEILFLPANSFLACVALSEIGLRDSPVSSRPGIHNWREEQVKQKAWYAKVKAGSLCFSFKGQNVEYRFKPDGMWETIALVNPPDDGPKPVRPVMSEPERPDKRSLSAAPEQGVSPRRNAWAWSISLALVILIGVIGWRVRLSSRRA